MGLCLSAPSDNGAELPVVNKVRKDATALPQGAQP